MRTAVLRITPSATGYSLAYYVGDDDEPLSRLPDADGNGGGKPDATDDLPDNLDAAAVANDGLVSLDARKYLKAKGEDDVVQRIGRHLLAAIDATKIGALWRKERKEAKDRFNASHAIELHTLLDIRDDVLRTLPWEFLADGANPLHVQDWATMARWRPGAPADAAVTPWPLKMLLVIGFAPGQQQLGWEDELLDILATVCPHRHWIDLEVFDCQQSHAGGCKVEMQKLITDFQPHVLHFIGHGRSSAGGTAALELWNTTQGQAEEWTAQDLAINLAAHPPRLAVLNACRTSQVAPNEDQTIRDLQAVGSALFSAGCPAVIGMQQDIPGPAAARFAAGFYEALIQGGRIDAALVAGRKRIASASSYPNPQWALPTLTLGTSVRSVLPMESAVPPGDSSDPEVKIFIDRRQERRKLRQIAAQATWVPGQNSPNVMLVRGDSELGKTSLLRCGLEWFLLQGHQVVYVDFDSGNPSPIEAIDVLRRIRGGQEPTSRLRPDFGTAFDSFTQTLNAVLSGRVPNFDTDSNVDELTSYTSKAHESAIPKAFDSFLACLETVAREKSLVIVLDHIGKRVGVLPDSFKRHIVERLLTPLLQRQGKHAIRVYVGVTPREIDLFGLQAFEMCPLEKFKPEEFNLLAREFMVLEKLNRVKALAFIDFWSKSNAEPWTPRVFGAMKVVTGGTS